MEMLPKLNKILMNGRSLVNKLNLKTASTLKSDLYFKSYAIINVRSFHISRTDLRSQRKGSYSDFPDMTDNDEVINIDKFVSSIDTTLNPEQQEKVKRIKKKIFGGNPKPCK